MKYIQPNESPNYRTASQSLHFCPFYPQILCFSPNGWAINDLSDWEYDPLYWGGWAEQTSLWSQPPLRWEPWQGYESPTQVRPTTTTGSWDLLLGGSGAPLRVLGSAQPPLCGPCAVSLRKSDWAWSASQSDLPEYLVLDYYADRPQPCVFTPLISIVVFSSLTNRRIVGFKWLAEQNYNFEMVSEHSCMISLHIDPGYSMASPWPFMPTDHLHRVSAHNLFWYGSLPPHGHVKT